MYFVSVHFINYKKQKKYFLTPTRKHLGKVVARGSKMAIAKECLKDSITSRYVINHLCISC